MITEAILSGFYSVVTTILSLLPDIPQIPNEISNGLSMITSLIGQTVGTISYLYTPWVLIGVFTILIAIINFEMIYKLVLWVYHKIRG